MVSVSLGALERHQHRRSEGVPTVSVLLGNAEVWEWTWRRWQRSRDISALEIAEPSVAGALSSWLGAAPVKARFRRRVLECAAGHSRISVTELEARITAHAASQQGALARELGRAAGLDPELVDAALAADTQILPELAARGFPQRLASIAAVLGEPTPALFSRAPASASERSLERAAKTLLALAEALPGAELAWLVDEPQFACWQRAAPPREVAALREGVLRLKAVVAAGSSAAHVVAGASQSDAIVAAGVGRPDCTVSDPGIVTYDELAFARSRAERALFERLKRRPRTAQLFELNRVLPDRFGSARLEVDLLCESLQIAVEVDGYHHFRDAAAYRRDRSKDVLLQGLGYVVVRVLASDVMNEIDFVLSTIDQVVERQQRSKRA